MMLRLIARLWMTAFLFVGAARLAAEETLPSLVDGASPQNVDELWRGFDPRKEPLETEILHQWEQDSVILRVVRFRIGVFKGQPARLAGVFGYPKSASGDRRVPGLLQIHGGGQYADHQACLTNAKPRTQAECALGIG